VVIERRGFRPADQQLAIPEFRQWDLQSAFPVPATFLTPEGAQIIAYPTIAIPRTAAFQTIDFRRMIVMVAIRHRNRTQGGVTLYAASWTDCTESPIDI